MNHVKLRRIALSIAATSFGFSAMLLLIGSIAFPNLMQMQTDVIKKSTNQTVTLPCYVPGTELWIKNLASYDGSFSEAGRNSEVFNTAAIVIENKTSQTVLYAQIELKTSDQSYNFEAMMLPPDSQTLIPEINEKNTIEKEIIECTGWSVSAPEHMRQKLRIKSIDMSTIEVINICDHTLSDIHLYHKTFLSDSEIYIGGIATETTIPFLHPGESIQIKPDHYADGYSKIV